MRLWFEMSELQLNTLLKFVISARMLAREEQKKFFINKYSSLPIKSMCMKLGRYDHSKYGGCAYCCQDCNLDNHRCHFCGDGLHHNGLEGPNVVVFEHSCMTKCALCGEIGHNHFAWNGDKRVELSHPWTQPSMERVPPSIIVGGTSA